MFDFKKKSEKNDTVEGAPYISDGKSENAAADLNPRSVLSPIKDTIVNFEERINRLEEKGRRRGKRYSWIGIISSIIICGGVLIGGYVIVDQINSFSKSANESILLSTNIKTSSSSKPVIHSAWKNCKINTDCQETQKGCCTCSNGGVQEAVNYSFLDEWNNSLKKKCNNEICQASNKCRSGVPECINEKCIFVFSNEETTASSSDCALAGQSIGAADMPEKCCADLKPMSGWPGGYDGDCGAPPSPTGLSIYSNCGDKNCDINNGENICNCTEDCNASSTPAQASDDPDNDGLTDQDEKLYGTDPKNPDTDNDGYSDGQEVKGGYDPNGEGNLINN